MLIDWFTVGAQVLNFLVLVWLLKRFLYKPILNALDAREKRIAGEIADAAMRRSEAEEERDGFRRRNGDLDRRRDELMGRAKEDAEACRQRLLGEARQAADELRIRMQEALERDHRTLEGELAVRVREEVFAIAGRTLGDLAGVGLEERMIEVFVHRLRSLDAEAREGLAAALGSDSGPVLVRSAFVVPPGGRTAIREALGGILPAGFEVRWEVEPATISGVEIKAGGRKIAWSIADHLASMERCVGELLDEQGRSAAPDEGRPAPGPGAGTGRSIHGGAGPGGSPT